MTQEHPLSKPEYRTIESLAFAEAMSKAGFYKVQLIDSNDSIVWEVK